MTMRKIFIIAGIVLALVIAVAIILPFVIDINAIVAGQLPKLENQIHRKIQIGHVKLTVLTGLGAEINDVRISNHPDFKKEDFVRINNVKATVQILPLLKKEILISSVSIKKPSVLIEKNNKGIMNFSDMIPAKDAESEKKSDTGPADPLSALEKIQISKISIQDGNFTFIDASGGSKAKEFSLDKLNLTLKAVSLAQKINIDFETDVYASPKAGHVKLSGYLGPIGPKLAFENIPVDLTLALDDVNLLHLSSYIDGMDLKTGAISAKTSLKGRFQDKLQCRAEISWNKLEMALRDAQKKDAPSPAISINGPWQMEADISGTLKSPIASGKLNLDKSAIEYGKTFKKPENTPLNVEFDVASKQDAREIKKIIARIGPLEATLKGRIPQDRTVDVSLQTNSFSAAKLLSLLPQTAESLPKDLKLPDAVILSASASGMADDLGFQADVDLTQGNIALGHVFEKASGTPLSATAAGRVKKDNLRIDNLKLTLSKLVLTANADIRNFADPLIDGNASVAATPLNSLAPMLPGLKAYELQGTLELSEARFKGKIDELKNLKGVSGSLTLNDGSAVSAELGKKIEKIHAAVFVADNAIQIQNTSFRVDASDATVNATIRNPATPDITFNLASSYLDVDSLLPPPAGDKKPAAGPAAKSGPGEKQKAPDLRANGKVSIKKCKYNQLIFDNVTAELQYANAVAALKNLSFDTFGGNVKTSAEVNLADMDSPQWRVDLTTRDINANAALSQFTSIKDTFFGNFNGNLTLQGKGADWAAISKNLTGSGSTDILNGKLAKVNVLDAVGQSLLKFQGLSMVAQAVAPRTQKQLNETEFNDLAGKFNIKEGKIFLDALNMVAKDFKLAGSGFIGLDKSLDVNAVLTLSKSASERFANDKVMKYLLNKDQLLEIPCAFKGDATSPRITADGDSLSRLMQNAAAKAAQEKIEKKVEEKLGKEADQLLKQIFKPK